MKKETVLLLCCIISFSIINSKETSQQEEITELSDCDYPEWDNTEETFENNGFLDGVAEKVKNIEHGKIEISMLDRLVIGARAAYHFCIIVPYQKACDFLDISNNDSCQPNDYQAEGE